MYKIRSRLKILPEIKHPLSICNSAKFHSTSVSEPMLSVISHCLIQITKYDTTSKITSFLKGQRKKVKFKQKDFKFYRYVYRHRSRKRFLKFTNYLNFMNNIINCFNNCENFNKTLAMKHSSSPRSKRF